MPSKTAVSGFLVERAYLHVQDGIRQEAIRKFAQAFPLEDIPPEDPETGSCRVIRFPHVG